MLVIVFIVINIYVAPQQIQVKNKHFGDGKIRKTLNYNTFLDFFLCRA